MKGQDEACSNISIVDDAQVEEDEVFNVTITEVSNTFAEGFVILRASATVRIEDDDGRLIYKY